MNKFKIIPVIGFVFTTSFLTILLTINQFAYASTARDLTPDEIKNAQELLEKSGYICPRVTEGTMINEEPYKLKMHITCTQLYIYNIDIEFVFPYPYPDHCPPKPGAENETMATRESTEDNQTTADDSNDPPLPPECIPEFNLFIEPVD